MANAVRDDDVPPFNEPDDPIPTNESGCVSRPVLALAAEDETNAQDALERVIK